VTGSTCSRVHVHLPDILQRRPHATVESDIVSRHTAVDAADVGAAGSDEDDGDVDDDDNAAKTVRSSSGKVGVRR